MKRKTGFTRREATGRNVTLKAAKIAKMIMALQQYAFYVKQRLNYKTNFVREKRF